MATLISEEIAKIEPDHSNLAVIVIDVNPKQRLLVDNAAVLNRCLESVIAFGNCHLMQSQFNKLAVIAAYSETCKYLYSGSESEVKLEKNDGQYEPFAIIERTIKDNFKQYSGYLCSTNEGHSESLIAGSIAMALCYIMKIKKETDFNLSLSSRILVISGSGNSASHYMDFMNIFFTAQKLNVVLDVCSLDHDLNLLQQGCDITGGKYLKIPQIQAMLQYLLWVFLPDQRMRDKLNLPPPSKIDYRAACFCHQQLIDIGFVCSICLSVFCKFSPICTTCHAVFNTPTPLSAATVAKKRKN